MIISCRAAIVTAEASHIAQRKKKNEHRDLRFGNGWITLIYKFL